MLIINNEELHSRSDIFFYLPKKLRHCLDFAPEDGLEEIRLRRGLPVSLCYDGYIRYPDHNGAISDNPTHGIIATREHIDDGIELITASSVYAVENRIQNGYITLKGGHRVGICGSCVIKNGKIAFIEDISGLNYRLSRQIKGVANGVIDTLIDNGRILGTLIIAPPGMGKTTLLRDIVRGISSRGFKVSVVDERSEISGIYDGKIMYDLGPNTDVLDNSPKADGVMMMLRSMSPDVIVTDEIGGADDMRAVLNAAVRGVGVIATVHARDVEDVRKNPNINLSLFERFITITKKNSAREVSVI